MSTPTTFHPAPTAPPPSPSPSALAPDPVALLAQVEAMQAELDSLREVADARRYHMERVERELVLAARLQRDFLPKRLPNHGRVKFNRLYRPAGHVSGDLYDVRRLDEAHAGVYLADAIGHGMPAALLAMFMHNALQTKRIAADGGSAQGYRLLESHEAMRHLNEVLCGQDLAHTTFATAIYARVNLMTGGVDFARGGHPLPMLVRAGGRVEEVGGEGALLGVMAEEAFEPCTVELAPGDKLILFTDGVETLFVPPGGSPDLDRWRQAIDERRHLKADVLLASLWEHLERRGAPDDDAANVNRVETRRACVSPLAPGMRSRPGGPASPRAVGTSGPANGMCSRRPSLVAARRRRDLRGSGRAPPRDAPASRGGSGHGTSNPQIGPRRSR